MNDNNIGMLFFPNCKINIGLDILRKRPDGYHDIETVMYPVYGLCDGLEIIRTDTRGETQFSESGLPSDCPPDDNLVMKAWKLMEGLYGLGNVKIHLHKTIPSGAGLGGGSADAAFTIKGLDRLFSLGLTTGKMEELAAKVGSDVPFFIRNSPQLCSGRGEIMKPVEVQLKGKFLLIVKPDIHVSTAEAYSSVVPETPVLPLSEIEGIPLWKWKENIKNSFEKALFGKYPQLGLLKKSLYECGAVYVSMTGSGSAIYGIFETKPNCLTKIYAQTYLIEL